jgi:ectoine hydroxylase-related dioxygenase (phytanoyl-CoA dioxygenase family)
MALSKSATCNGGVNLKIEDEVIAAYQQDGAVLLRGVFTDWVEILREGLEKNRKTPGPFGKIYPPVNGGGEFFGDYCNWSRIEQYSDFFYNSPVAQIGAQLMESSETRLFHEHVLVKEPGSQNVTPWHHDQPYYCVDGRQVVSLWIPLDDVAQNSCPEFVKGSHDWGKWFMPRKFSGVDYDHKDSNLEPIPDFDSQRDQHEFLSWNLKAGDAIGFHYLTVHGAPVNTSRQTRRRAFSARLLGDDARYVIRSGEMSPPFPGLDKKLQPGAKMDSEEFPLIWSSKTI